MKQTKPTPYTRLFDQIKNFCLELRYPKEKILWTYPKARLNDGWGLTELHTRVSTAKHLGYEVIIESSDEGLVIKYREKVKIPFGWL